MIQVFLIEFEEKWGFPKRDGALSVAQIFGALIWQIGLPDRPTARPSHPPTPAHCSSLLLGHTLRHHSLFMDSCLIYFFFSPCVTSLHPSVTVLSSLILEFFFCFYLFIYFKEASSCSRFIVWSHCSCSEFASWSTVRMTCFHSLRDVWMKGIVRHNKPEPLF